MNQHTPDNEVARLREALELIASPMRPDGTYNRDRRACELLAKEALATAPEEPKTSAHIDKCIGNVTKFTHEGNLNTKFKQLHEVASIIVEYIEDPDRRSYYRSQIQQLTPTTEETSEKDTSTETSPSQKDTEWRELGPDEMICENDELFYEPNGRSWERCGETYSGLKPRKLTNYRFRTRRPLPNTSESPKSSKQVEMPLEDELDYLTREASRASDIHNHVLIVDCLRYLRDEIQKIHERQEDYRKALDLFCKQLVDFKTK